MAAKEPNPLPPPCARPEPPSAPPRKSRPMGYDTRCGDLARHFLSDVAGGVDEAEVKELAQTIQDAVEGHFSMREARAHGEPCPVCVCLGRTCSMCRGEANARALHESGGGPAHVTDGPIGQQHHHKEP